MGCQRKAMPHEANRCETSFHGKKIIIERTIIALKIFYTAPMFSLGF